MLILRTNKQEIIEKCRKKYEKDITLFLRKDN